MHRKGLLSRPSSPKSLGIHARTVGSVAWRKVSVDA